MSSFEDNQHSFAARILYSTPNQLICCSIVSKLINLTARLIQPEKICEGTLQNAIPFCQRLQSNSIKADVVL